MLTIHENMVMADRSSKGSYTFLAEASELRLDGFPREMKTSLGNGENFVGHSKKVDGEGDLLYVRYRQRFSCIDLIVFND